MTNKELVEYLKEAISKLPKTRFDIGEKIIYTEDDYHNEECIVFDLEP